MEGWHGQQLALALDATTLGQRFTVLAISVLYRGCAVPVAWRILKADQEHPWKPEWETLLSHFQKVVPADWKVIVLTDRGLYAKWLFQAITKLGWHPLMRINLTGKFRPEGWHHWRNLKDVVGQIDQQWQGRGTAFRTASARLECTLLARWDEGYEDPWLVVTDLPPGGKSVVCWYGLRAWIEQGFKRIKSGGWQWQYTRMDDPARAERLWLAVAVATWWLLSVGGEADAKILPETMEPAPRTHGRYRPASRLIAIFRRGSTQIMAALLHRQKIPLGKGIPEPWPETIPPLKLTSIKQSKTKNLQL